MSARAHVRKVLALSGASAVAVSLAILVPSAAQAATTTYAVDCNDLPSSGSTFYVAAAGDTFTFDLTGFATVYDYDTSSDIASLNPAGDTWTVNPGDNLSFGDTDGNSCSDWFDVSVEVAAPETVPSGSLLFTRDLTIPAAAPEIVVEDNTGDGEHYLDGNDTCGLSTDIDGRHVYGTLDVTVTTAGTFTFRGLSSNPVGYYNSVSPYDPIGDPFLAVYRGFDPAQPDEGVVGCSDDLNDVEDSNGDTHDAEVLSDGSIVDGHQPYFTAALTPGNYTLVLSVWEDLGSSDFADGYGPWEEDNFAIGAKSTRFQLWGPAGSLSIDGETATGNTPTGDAGSSGTTATTTVAAAPSAQLAETGADTRPGLVGLAALTLGLLLLGAARLRRRSA